MSITLEMLRRYAVARTFFTPTTLSKAIVQLGFVQADPIRSPARAQDLVLRHRVKAYCVGDLDARYSELGIEEDFFVNYGFMPRKVQALMHPRGPQKIITPQQQEHLQGVLNYVRQHGIVHPKQVDEHLAYGTVSNWFGGKSKASTRLLDQMHLSGLLRVAGRVNGVRTYVISQMSQSECLPEQAIENLDQLIDVIVNLYAPMSQRSLHELVAYLLRGGAAQWAMLKREALSRAQLRLAKAKIDGVLYFWPASENLVEHASGIALEPTTPVRIMAPFDPLVWDRRRFEHFWGWGYRFEAYIPAAQRQRGYYAMPVLWREQMIGWANVSIMAGQMQVELGYVANQAPKDAVFKTALECELEELKRFLKLNARISIGTQ